MEFAAVVFLVIFVVGVLLFFLRSVDRLRFGSFSLPESPRPVDLSNVDLAAPAPFKGVSKPFSLKFRRRDFLSVAEQKFLVSLERSVGFRFRIYTKVRLSDLIEPCSRSRGDLNRIIRRHVDFVLCDRFSFVPCLIIELDDSSHLSRFSVFKDAQKDAFLLSAGFPILRVRCRTYYSFKELRTLINSKLNFEEQGMPTPSTSAENPFQDDSRYMPKG